MEISKAERIINKLERDPEDRFLAFFLEGKTDKAAFFKSDNIDFGDALRIVTGVIEHFGIHPLALANIIPSDLSEDLNYTIKQTEQALEQMRELKKQGK